MTAIRSARVIMPLPARDFDPSEAAVTWQILKAAGHAVGVATPEGAPAAADPRMLTGEELDLWGGVRGLRSVKLLGLALRANARARRAYAKLERDPAFRRPLRYRDLRAADFDALVLPGGHWSRGMRAYLEDALLQRLVAEFFDSDKPVGAICHGVLLAARSRSLRTGRSVLYGRKTTALTWALENAAWSLMKVAGRVWDPDYYRTYLEAPGQPRGYQSVQAEVTRALARPEDFLDVTRDAPDRFRKASGLFRDRPGNERPAWVVRDGNYVSARWPGDVHRFARTLAEVLMRASATGP
jgi:putative intracellular protease/amidase